MPKKRDDPGHTGKKYQILLTGRSVFRWKKMADLKSKKCKYAALKEQTQLS